MIDNLFCGWQKSNFEGEGLYCRLMHWKNFESHPKTMQSISGQFTHEKPGAVWATLRTANSSNEIIILQVFWPEKP